MSFCFHVFLSNDNSYQYVSGLTFSTSFVLAHIPHSVSASRVVFSLVATFSTIVLREDPSLRRTWPAHLNILLAIYSATLELWYTSRSSLFLRLLHSHVVSTFARSMGFSLVLSFRTFIKHSRPLSAVRSPGLRSICYRWLNRYLQVRARIILRNITRARWATASVINCPALAK